MNISGKKKNPCFWGNTLSYFGNYNLGRKEGGGGGRESTVFEVHLDRRTHLQ